jgi:integrase/recombinase XerC
MTAQAMSSPSPAELDAVRLLLARMGVSPVDLLQAAPTRPAAPTFAEYIPMVSAAVGAGTRRVNGSYWNRILDQWGQRRLDEPTPSDIERSARCRTQRVTRFLDGQLGHQPMILRR